MVAFDRTSISKWFYIFIFLHLCLWTIVPTLIRYTIPMDSLEGYVWGQTLQLGYDRNPWLNAWLTAIAVELGGRSGWLVYFFSQFSVTACFLSLWKLGKKFLHPVYVLAAILILESIQYYNVAAIDFNDNVLEVGLWALLTLYFYQAVKEQKLRDWILVGVFAALALMAKYFAVMLFFPMFMFLLCSTEGRKSFTKIGVYCGFAVFLLGIAPHFIWSLYHDMSTFNYALRRVNDVVSDWHSSSLYFLSMHLLAFLPPLFLFCLLGFGKNDGEILGVRQKLSSYDSSFLLWMALGPLFFTVILAMLFKFTLHVMWGMPLLSLWGLAFAAFWQPKITAKKLHRFLVAIFIVFFAIISAYSCSLLFDGYKSSANYPGQDIANYVFKQWSAHYKVNPYYVVGDRYVAGNVAFFASTKLYPCIIDEHINTCPDDQELQNKGAIFVWRNDLSPNENLLAKIKALSKSSNYNQMEKLTDKDFVWKRNPDKPALNIGATFLFPPNE